MSTTRNELWVIHKPCGHTWIIAYLPMEMAKVAKVMSAALCPKCGVKKEIFMPKEADIAAALAPTVTA
jgi:hypothetical protein